MKPPPIPAKDACGFHIGPRQAQWVADYARAYAQAALDAAVDRVNGLAVHEYESPDFILGESSMRSKVLEAMKGLRNEV